MKILKKMKKILNKSKRKLKSFKIMEENPVNREDVSPEKVSFCDVKIEESEKKEKNRELGNLVKMTVLKKLKKIWKKRIIMEEGGVEVGGKLVEVETLRI